MSAAKTIVPADAALLRQVADGVRTYCLYGIDTITAPKQLRALADWLESPEFSCLCCGSVMSTEKPYCARCVPDRAGG